MNNLKNKNAITLVALVVTMVVMLILATIIITTTLGKNGIFNSVRTAKEKHIEAKEKEDATISNYGKSISGIRDIDKAEFEKLFDEYFQKKVEEGATNPTGTIISFLGNKGTDNKEVPEGYLACDGKTYNIADYSQLADQIEKTMGSKNYYGGDGTTTFAVPNLQGEFLRGAGNNGDTTQGNGANVGVHQKATQMPRVWNYAASASYAAVIWESNGYQTNEPSNMDKGLTTPTRYFRDAGAGSISTGNSTTIYAYTARPTNTSVLYCIKY